MDIEDPAAMTDSVLGIGYWILGIGYWVLDIGYWVLGIGYWIFAFLTSALTLTKLCFKLTCHRKRAMSTSDILGQHIL
ncbi:MAG: hypothetical protein FVQ82_04835 [Planctomycetes bacterium]|nr:hypothetical protein [Planctomycetota bacterium]